MAPATHYKTLFMRYENPANALDVSPDSRSVVIAGKGIFKIFHLGENELVERLNLRIGRYLNLNYSCSDVAWSKLDEYLLATAATNGSVVLWNLAKTSRSKQEYLFAEHKRTVNKVNFNPLDPNILISGSHDSVIKAFDLRTREVVASFSSTLEAVRDVQFSPHNQNSFASVAENGRVTLWDLRRPERPEKSWPAHAENVLSCDWHPEIAHWLATAGRDKAVKVWRTDLSRPKCDTTINTVGPVSRVKWRPGNRAHLASGSLAVDFSVNVWDIRRPFVPLASFENHRDATTGLCWRGEDPDTLLSTSRDGTLYQNAFADATLPSQRASPVGLDVDPKGGMVLTFRNNDPGVQPGHKSAIDEQSRSHIPHPPPMPPLPPGAVASSSTAAATSSVVAHGQNNPGILVSSSYSAVSHGQGMLMHHQSQQLPHHQQSYHQQQHYQHHYPHHHHQRNNSISGLTSPAGTAVSSGAIRVSPSDPWMKNKGEESFKPSRSKMRCYSVVNSRDVGTTMIENISAKRVGPTPNLDVASMAEVDAATDTRWFTFSAMNYWLTGKNFDTLCDHNSFVADVLGRSEVSASWQIIKALYGFLDFGALTKEQEGPREAAVKGKGEEVNCSEHRRRNTRSSKPRNISGARNNSGLQAASGIDQRDETSGGGGGAVGNNAEGGTGGDSGSDGDSSSESDHEEDALTLTNIATDPKLSGFGFAAGAVGGFDFFGDNDPLNSIERFEQFGTMAAAAAAAAENRGADDDFEWNLKAEGFELQHELKETTDHDQAAAEEFFLNGVQAQEEDVSQKMNNPAEDEASLLLKVSDLHLTNEPWSPDETISSTLKYFADKGDIQSTVSIYLVIGHDRLKHLIDNSLAIFWFQSYIELLQRFKLFNQAADIIRKSPLQAICDLSMDSTTYLSNCTACHKALSRPGGAWYCERCRSLPNLCAICHKVVKGVFVWCQGCGHGGHLGHIRAWYQKEKSCPMGCTHFCQYQ